MSEETVTNESTEEETAKINAHRAALLELYHAMIDNDDEIKEIKNTTKDMIDRFLEVNPSFTKKSLKAGYNFFKKILKDKNEAVAEDFEIEKVKEIVAGI